jgi:beta-aspartyl-peptidase (threonine type)
MISMIVHGGAWDIPDNAVESHYKGVEHALEVGWKILKSGGNAIDAVEQAVRIMENDETFDAGYGSHLNQLGEVELDASIMDGKTIRCGAVAAVHHIKNPITLARKIMDESEHILLVGNGAEQYAKEHGITICEPAELVTQRERDRWESLRTKKEFKTKDAFKNLIHLQIRLVLLRSINMETFAPVHPQAELLTNIRVVSAILHSSAAALMPITKLAVYLQPAGAKR